MHPLPKEATLPPVAERSSGRSDKDQPLAFPSGQERQGRNKRPPGKRKPPPSHTNTHNERKREKEPAPTPEDGSAARKAKFRDSEEAPERNRERETRCSEKESEEGGPGLPNGESWVLTPQKTCF